MIRYLNGTFPIKQPFGVYQSRVDISKDAQVDGSIDTSVLTCVPFPLDMLWNHVWDLNNSQDLSWNLTIWNPKRMNMALSPSICECWVSKCLTIRWIDFRFHKVQLQVINSLIPFAWFVPGKSLGSAPGWKTLSGKIRTRDFKGAITLLKRTQRLGGLGVTMWNEGDGNHDL